MMLPKATLKTTDIPTIRQYCYRCRDRRHIRAVQRKYAIPLGIKYLLGQGEWPDKNLMIALDAFAGFIRKYQVSDLFFVVRGLCRSRQLDLLRERIADMNTVQYKLVRIGPVEQADIAPLMGGAFAFAMPVSGPKGFLPVLEAMTCGCPVICARDSTASKLIGDAGIQIDANTREELISAYHNLYSDKKFRHACIRKGLKRAEQITDLFR
ncbi:MAG: glycosyltransferase [Alphaproteobacteria bacterium]|nr:glycosyltransferase [Alphaproteobacteria bacterium]